MRRIVQINTVVRGNASGNIYTVALCDDGSLWSAVITSTSEPKWYRLPGVPDGIDGDQTSE